MLLDGSPAYPMDCCTRVRFSGGGFDRAALEAAQRKAIERHPLLNACVERGRRGKWQWIPAPDGVPPITWLSQPTTDSYPAIGSGLDLRRQGGVRLIVTEHGGQSDLTMHQHHACCDGLGAVQYLTDVLATYVQELGGPLARPLPPPPNVDALRYRQSLDLSPRQILRMIPAQLTGIMGAKRSASTCVFTNLGPAFSVAPFPLCGGKMQVANLRLESADGAAPLRPYTWVAFVAMAYAGGMSLTLHYDSRVLSAEQAGDLADEFARRARNAGSG
jgi:hypothetical protein